MAGGNYDQSNVSVAVNGQVVEDLAGLSIPDPEAMGVEFIYAGGGRAIGFNVKTMANSTSASFSVSMPSSDAEFLMKLCATKENVDFTYSYDDEDELPDGYPVGFTSAKCKIYKGGDVQLGDNPGDLQFTVTCIGYTWEFKGGGKISVDAAGQVSIT